MKVIQYARAHKRLVITLVLLLTAAALATYHIVNPKGFFANLKNDLKIAESDSTALYTNLDGTQVSIKDYAGKPLVVTLWATWMPFSKDDLQVLTFLREQYGTKVGIVAMNRKEESILIRSYLSSVGHTYQIDHIRDTNDHFYNAVGGFSMPETIVFDQNGVKVAHIRGTLNQTDMTVLLTPLIE